MTTFSLRKFLLATSIATLLAPATALSSDQIKMAPEPDWVPPSELAPIPADPTGLAFVRRDDHFTRLGHDTDVAFRSQRMRLLDSRSLTVGNLALVWNPDAGDPTLHRLQVHRDGDIIDVLETNSFEIIRREDNLEHAMLDGHLTAMLRIPDLRVGDELDFSYSTPIRDLAIAEDSFGLMSFSAMPLSGNFRLGLSWEDGAKPKYRFTEDFRGHDSYSNDSVVLSLENPEMLTPSKDVPPRYSWRRILEFSDFGSWEDVSRKFHELYEPAITLEADSSIKSEAARIARKSDDPMERAREALTLIQQ